MTLRNQLLSKCPENNHMSSKNGELHKEQRTNTQNGFSDNKDNGIHNDKIDSPQEHNKDEDIILKSDNSLQSKEIEEKSGIETNVKEPEIKKQAKSVDEDEIIILDAPQQQTKGKNRSWQSTLTFLSTIGAQRRINEFFKSHNQSLFNENDIDISSDTDSQYEIYSAQANTSSNIHDFSNIHYAHCFGDADETTLYHLTIDGLHTILGDRFHLR